MVSAESNPFQTDWAHRIYHLPIESAILFCFRAPRSLISIGAVINCNSFPFKSNIQTEVWIQPVKVPVIGYRSAEMNPFSHRMRQLLISSAG